MRKYYNFFKSCVMPQHQISLISISLKQYHKQCHKSNKLSNIILPSCYLRIEFLLAASFQTDKILNAGGIIYIYRTLDSPNIETKELSNTVVANRARLCNFSGENTKEKGNDFGD
ncbi:hypothetical protein, unlikely [Trypanosoma congolense IL3000]|uniref:Uncharacterized protein n=1 Tax=Trypanosoma congolense (strain IL3000) TaxID=1068625 RepID=F9W825_TRYCI|nr:hypothetical protein, unlikely [Trypanosoma congolense IL3000]